MVNTVAGAVPAEKLGITSIHEHLIVKPGELPRHRDYTLGSIDKSSREAESFRDAGGSTIVDLAPLNFGRDPDALAEISERTGVNVVFVTGFHKDEFIPRWFFELSDDEIADVVAGEISDGVGERGARPGAVKVGTSYREILPSERRAIGICASVARDLHLPMITHADKGTMALEQLELIAAAGMDLAHVCVSHVDLTFDVEYLKRVCDTGASLSFDHVGRSLDDGDVRCTEMLAELVRSGYGDRVCLAGDMGKGSYLPAYGGTPGLAYILCELRDRLAERIGKDAFLHMVADNPQRVLDTPA